MHETAIKGVKLSLAFAVAYFAYWFVFIHGDTFGGQGAGHTMLTPLLVGCALILLSGYVLGFYAGKFQGRRRLKIILMTILVYWYNAYIVAAFIITAEPGQTWFDILFGALMLSISGAILFSWLLLPLMILVSMYLERITRPQLV
jgi:hypothetical protein